MIKYLNILLFAVLVTLAFGIYHNKNANAADVAPNTWIDVSNGQVSSADGCKPLINYGAPLPYGKQFNTCSQNGPSKFMINPYDLLVDLGAFYIVGLGVITVYRAV